jgi:hypothetical protein
MYAITMGVLYCLFVPLGSFFLLLANKKNIQELQLIEHSRTILDDKNSALNSGAPACGPSESEVMPSVLSGAMIDSNGELEDVAQINNDGDPENEKKQDPDGETEHDRALRRMDRRRDDLIRGNPVLGGLSPLFAGDDMRIRTDA